MDKLRAAEFRSVIVDEGIEDETDFVEFPGRITTAIIADMLADLGYEVSLPIDGGVRGWELNIEAGGRRFWLLVSVIDEDENYLHLTDETRRFWRRHPSFADFLRHLDGALRRDGRFQNLLWFRDYRDATRSTDRKSVV